MLKIFKEGLLGRVPRYAVAALDTPSPTFREKEYGEYKITRPPTEKDLSNQLQKLPFLLDLFGLKTVELPGWEADDLIATLAERFKVDGRVDLIMVLSGDLDILQIVDDDKVVVLTPQKGISQTTLYNEEGVIKRFGIPPSLLADYKGLVGDQSDNIPGVPGIGPKTAAHLISRFGSLESLYKEIEEIGLPNLRLQNQLTNFKQQALLSKKLAVLDKQAPLKTPALEQLLFLEQLKSGDLKAYFKELGFDSLIERLAKL
jgi:DNA polymerase-1